MGAQHSTVGRTKSLDESGHEEYQQNNGPRRSGSITSGQLRPKEGEFNRMERDGKSKSTLVIVHRPSQYDPSMGQGRVEDDPLFKKLDELPMFVPLMHEVESGSKLFGARNRALQEIRSKISLTPFIHIVRLYEDRLRRHADSLNVEQGRLSKCVREGDMNVAGIFKSLTEEQKKFAKHAENLGKMNDISHTLIKCQIVLKECERNLQILNGLLPQEERLEPFSWADMFEEPIDEREKVEVEGSRKVKISTGDIAGTSGCARVPNRTFSSTSTVDVKSNLESDESVEVAVEQGES